VQKSELLRCKFHLHIIQPGYIAAWPVEAGHKADLNGVYAGTENDWYCCGGGFGGERSLGTARGGNYGNRPTDQIGGQFRQVIQYIVRPSVFDGYVPVLKITALAQAFLKSSKERSANLRTGVQITDDRHS
jgi:hypothetical protein